MVLKPFKAMILLHTCMYNRLFDQAITDQDGALATTRPRLFDIDVDRSYQFKVEKSNGSLPMLILNPYSWTKVSGIIFVDSTVGTGFSYARNSVAYQTGDSLQIQQLLQFLRKEKNSWEMNNQERIDAAGKRKDEGNVLFKVRKYERAAKKYNKALDYLSEEDESFEDEELKVVKPIRVSCWLNAVACCLKLEDFHEAIKFRSQVLEIEFHNVKALYRRAQAFIEMSDLVLAEMDIKKALEVDPENREVKLLQKSLGKLKAESNKRDATLYSNMFSRMAKVSSPASKKQKVDNAENGKRMEELVAMEIENVGDSSAPVENGVAVDSGSL